MVQKAAIYCRVSTADQSCERQERDLLDYAHRCGYEVVQVFKETGSGARNDRLERKKVMSLARAREISIVLVTELSRWGRSTQDLLETLEDLQSWGVSLIAQTGLQFDLSSPQGRLFTLLMAGLAQFERELVRERVKSGLAAARARGKRLGRPEGHTKADRYTAKVLKLVEEGRSYRLTAKDLGLSKSTVNDIVKRHRSVDSKN